MVPPTVGLLISLLIVAAMVSFVVWALRLPTPQEEALDGPEPSKEDWEDDALRANGSGP